MKKARAGQGVLLVLSHPEGLSDLERQLRDSPVVAGVPELR